MAKRSRVIVENTITVNNSVETRKASNGNVANVVTDPFWDQVKMADFRFAMRQFENGSEEGIPLSWRGLVHKLLTLKDENSDKQVFVTVFESDGDNYSATLRMRIILSENGIGYSLCRILEGLQSKDPKGVFVRIDVRDTITVSQTLTLLRERFPNKS